MIEDKMNEIVVKTNFKIPLCTKRSEGKVRDIYFIDDKFLVLVASDRISAFDVILPKGIPYKGQILNMIANFHLDKTKDIIDNWVKFVPDPNVTIGVIAKPIMIEMIVREYMSGHMWRLYKSGKREICGNKLPEGLKENDRLENPIITPSSKAENGLHDEDITKEEIIRKELVTEKEYEYLCDISFQLFARGKEIASNQGLILVDTKYEFGKLPNGKIILIDEIHTPDSSRYFFKDQYDLFLENGSRPGQLSKEYVREWLMKNNFSGKEGQEIPEMTDGVVEDIMKIYISAYEMILSKPFKRTNNTNILNRIEKNINEGLLNLINT